MAVNSTVTEGTAFPRHSYLNKDTLHIVPYPVLVPEEGLSSVPLQKDFLLEVHGMTENTLGQQWALVTNEFGRTGYVIADLKYLAIELRGCVEFKP